MLAGILMTHMVAHREKKPPFFFSRFNLQGMHERGNTHYCFHCGGGWGFTPDKDGNPTNHMDSRVMLEKEGEHVLIGSTLRSEVLNLHLTEESKHRTLTEGCETWCTYTAQFDHSPEFEAWCVANGYTVHRYNPMEGHDPVTHADAVVGGADKFRFASDWLEKKIGPDFPYIVAVT